MNEIIEIVTQTKNEIESALVRYCHSVWSVPELTIISTVSVDPKNGYSWHEMIRGIHYINLACIEIYDSVLNDNPIVYEEQRILRTTNLKVSWRQYLSLLLSHEIAHGLQAVCSRRRDLVVDRFGLKLRPDFHHHGPVWQAFYRELRTKVLENYFADPINNA